MLEILFWFIVIPFVLAFILGFMSYGLGETANPTKPDGKVPDSTAS